MSHCISEEKQAGAGKPITLVNRDRHWHLLELLDPGQQGLDQPRHPWMVEVAAGMILLAVLALCL